MESQSVDDPYGILAASEIQTDQKTLAFASQILKTLSQGATLPSFADEAKISLEKSDVNSGDECPECGCPLIVRELSYECPKCHIIREPADLADVLPVSRFKTPGAEAYRGRLRIVGSGANWYQRDLDRTNPSKYSETQKKTIYAELLRFNNDFASRGGNPFTLDVLKDVAENYHIIQKNSVKRSTMKRSILAALVFHSCIRLGFIRNKKDVAEFAKLPTHGIARGDDFVRSVHEDNGLEIDVNCSRLNPHITTTFAELDLSGEEYETLREAVRAIVMIAEDNHIGFKSVLRSKVIAATWEVLRRAEIAITMNDVVTKCHIRKHTIQRFLNNLVAYHSYFEEEYRKHELSDVCLSV